MTLCDGCNKSVELTLYNLRLTPDKEEDYLTLKTLHLCNKCKARVEVALKEAVAGILVSDLREAVPGLTSDQRNQVEAFYQRKTTK